ncbi:hypothetical protein XapB_23930 (plasmid) [Xanthomonas citri pv. punicae]|nr:hypothetical protein XapB_23930 [Xanthomonas citri pv. punicae]
MRSGYYWFVDQYGSAAEIVDVDVDEGFVHLIARDSPLYFPGADTAQGFYPDITDGCKRAATF